MGIPTDNPTRELAHYAVDQMPEDQVPAMVNALSLLEDGFDLSVSPPRGMGPFVASVHKDAPRPHCSVLNEETGSLVVSLLYTRKNEMIVQTIAGCLNIADGAK